MTYDEIRAEMAVIREKLRQTFMLDAGGAADLFRRLRVLQEAIWALEVDRVA